MVSCAAHDLVGDRRDGRHCGNNLAALHRSIGGFRAVLDRGRLELLDLGPQLVDLLLLQLVLQALFLGALLVVFLALRLFFRRRPLVRVGHPGNRSDPLQDQRLVREVEQLDCHIKQRRNEFRAGRRKLLQQFHHRFGSGLLKRLLPVAFADGELAFPGRDVVQHHAGDRIRLIDRNVFALGALAGDRENLLLVVILLDQGQADFTLKLARQQKVVEDFRSNHGALVLLLLHRDPACRVRVAPKVLVGHAGRIANDCRIGLDQPNVRLGHIVLLVGLDLL